MEINKAKFERVVEEAKAKASNDPKWLRAITKAAAAILSSEMIVTPLAHGALVTTANGTYAANGHCNCEAARRGHTQYYHRAAARMNLRRCPRLKRARKPRFRSNAPVSAAV